MWGPKKETREAVKFWLDCLQVISILGGIAILWFTIYKYQHDERAQLEAVARDLSKPYEEKRLNLYLEAAKVLAHLAATPQVDQDVTIARFWELYWGELAFVESSQVEGAMVSFCNAAFSAGCTTSSEAKGAFNPSPRLEALAIDFAHLAQSEIRSLWTRP